MPAAIDFRDVVSLAGRFPLLAGVTLRVEQGRIVYLRGPNGAGKTSLLRTCAGLSTIESGEATVLGHDLRDDVRDLRREVGLLGHANFLYRELTVEDNLRFALRAARAPLAGLEPAIERLGLSGRLRSTRVAQLSTGQARRVALAVLVARAPRLWLLDEPHAGLDESARATVDALVREVRAAGATVLLASHEAERAAALADEILEIDGGALESSSEKGDPSAEQVQQVVTVRRDVA